tara:strand:- start:536 stop:1102 length:567 start_codon:yes stop_codon:yes gene_type:complete
MKLSIIGGGTHSNVVIDLARLNGFKDFLIFDDREIKIGEYPDCKYIGKISLFKKSKKASYFIAIGDNKIRKKIFKSINTYNNNIVTLIHPNSYVSIRAFIGKGSILMPNTVVNANSRVGDCCIINTASTVDHDCKIENFTHIAPGVNIAGNVNIGSETFIGIGSKIINNINIKAKSFIKAGTLVKKNL